MSVGSGFIAARTTISSPFETPASIPPARFDVRRRSGPISSCASEPRSPASAKPSPISTPFTAWIPISAAASRASSRSSSPRVRAEPRRNAGARTSTRPPSVSRSLRASSTRRGIRSRLGQRLPRHLDPDLAEERLRHGAGRDVDGRVPCRRTLQRVADVREPDFCTPARSAWPGRGSVTGFVPFPSGSPSGGQGSSPTSSSCGRGCGRRARAACRVCGRGGGRRAPRPRPPRSAGAASGRTPAGGAGGRRRSRPGRGRAPPAGPRRSRRAPGRATRRPLRGRASWRRA